MAKEVHETITLPADKPRGRQRKLPDMETLRLSGKESTAYGRNGGYLLGGVQAWSTQTDDSRVHLLLQSRREYASSRVEFSAEEWRQFQQWVGGLGK